MDNGFIPRLASFAAKPFCTECDLWNWILFTILVVTVAIFWKMVLNTITEEMV